MNSSALGILVFGVGVVAKVIWELYLSPVGRQHIPGPKWAAVSDIWDYWMQVRRRRGLAYHDLFEVSTFIIR